MSDLVTKIQNNHNLYIMDGNRDPQIMYLGAIEYHQLMGEIQKGLRFASAENIQPLGTPMQWNGMFVMEVRWPSHVGFGS